MVAIKSKSSHHQSENTFKFQTFHERLTGVNIDVVRKFGRFQATPQDADTFFGEALEKWTDLNCTQNFVDFRKEIAGEVLTFVQLVHNQNDIITSLQKHLKVENSLALQPLLDLVVQLARDLQGDFYPHFKEFFEILVWVLKTRHHDVEALEQTFTCLAYLFKFLWRLMLKDIHSVYRLFSPLLGENHKAHINNFAAESFSFLMRKLKEQRELIKYMFKDLEENPDHAHGVGRLLFEMIKSVKKQFHSATEKVLPIIFSQVNDETLSQNDVFNALEEMFFSVAEHTSTDHCACIWQCMMDEIAKVSQLEIKEGNNVEWYMKTVLQLLRILISHRQGILLGKGEQVLEGLYKLLEECELSDKCAEEMFSVIAAVLLGSLSNIDAQHRPKLINLVYGSRYPRNLLFTFTTNVFELPLFEKDLLPALLTYCHELCVMRENCTLETKNDVLEILIKLCLHKTPPWTGVMEPQYMQTYLLDFSAVINRSQTKEPSMCSWIVKMLGEYSCAVIETEEQLTMLWSFLYILPSIRPIEQKNVITHVKEIITNLQECILTETSILPTATLHTVLGEAIISLYHLLKEDEFIKFMRSDMELGQLLRKNPQSVPVLRLVDLCFTIIKLADPLDSMLSTENFENIFSEFQSNFCSPYHKVRLHTLHMCCQFNLLYPVLPEDREIVQTGVFEICLGAEQVELDVHTYRDALLHLRKLDYNLVQLQLPIGNYQQVPLRYLVGKLFANFSLIWKPVIELIKSQAMGLKLDIFWEIYGVMLEQAAINAEKELLEEKARRSFKYPIKSTKYVEPERKELFESNISMYVTETVGLTDKIPWSHFRQLLWKAMIEFPSVCEPRSRIISPLLFRFLDNEYNPADPASAMYQDIRKAELRVDEENTSMLDASQLEETEQDPTDGDESSGKNTVIRKRTSSSKTFALHLTLFAQFRDPKSLYLEPRLRELYFKLLQHKNPIVQKVAFDCVITYKYKYLTPYKENFERLLEDKSFKREIVLFSIDQATTTIQPGDRTKLMPILMRILYGKMQTKTGKGTSGKNNTNVRKSIVLRFLAGSTNEELQVFLDLVLEPFLHLCSGKIDEAVENYLNKGDLSKVIPVRKQQSIMDTLEIILKKLANLLDPYLPKVYSILMCVAAQYAYILEQREMLAANTVTFMKNLRKIVQHRICEFFQIFERYPYSLAEVDAVFCAMVWPQLERLPHEGVYSPTGLLTLFFNWTENSRYFPLLAKIHRENKELSPLPFVFQLLHSKNVHKKVVNMIMDMTENLLTIEDFENTDTVKCLEVGLQVEIPAENKDTELSFGTTLVLPHVTSILDHLKTVVIKMIMPTGRKKEIPERELNILSKLSEHAQNEDQCCTIVNLLLPFLSKRIHRSQDVEVDILTAVKHLLSKVQEPEIFLSDISQLFSMLSLRESRTVLAQVLNSLTVKIPYLHEVSNIVTKLNAWDPKRVEEPDYMTRLQGFQESQRLACLLPTPQSENIDVVFCQFLLHNCSFVLSHTEDMSLRDNAAHCLQVMIQKIGEAGTDSELFKVIIKKYMLSEIRDKLKLQNEAARHEFVNLLAQLVRTFPECHLFDDLAGLTDSDMEKDFYSNIVHIQLHRRARALRKLCKHLSTSRIKLQHLMSYILPCVTCFINDQQYSKSSNLLDAAVEAIGAICRVLPWRKYLLLLKRYLEKLPRALENQKLIIRVVVTILDSFHFDLRNSQVIDGKAPIDKTSHDDCDLDEIKDDNANEDNKVENEEPTSNKDNVKKKAKVNEDEEILKSDDEDAMDTTLEGGGTSVMQIDDDVALHSKHLCEQGLATKIHQYIVQVIIVKLYRALTDKAKTDDQHKLAQATKYAEDEEVLRVPIALAMVKLLQALPGLTLEQNLPNVLLKVCNFLQSRAKDIREIARDTLLKIMQTLGSKYFSYILKELRFSLKRGYQLHVLCYTIWALLKNLHDTSKLCTGDLDTCIESLSEVFKEELFGHVAEEKEIDGIKGKLFEARTSKSYDSYGILSLYISKTSLPKIILPLKNELDNTNRHDNAKKASDALKKISLGLVDNKGLELETIMTFIYGLTTETMPFLQDKEKEDNEKAERTKANPRLKRTDTMLVLKEPKRGGNKPKMLKKTNLYIIVEFGFQVLNVLLKRSHLVATNQSHLEMLDPFIQPVCDSLVSKYIKITTTALRCLMWLLKFPLPSLKQHISKVTNNIFVLLNTYAATGAARGENFELVVMCFKVVTVLVRDVQYLTVTVDQLKVLLSYAEQDMHDYTRQATAFTLLKAIISRKLIVPEMADVMKKVEELSIQSEQPNVRLQCRQVTSNFLLDYPLGRKLRTHLEFYVRQLEYEYETGRESTLEMLATVIGSFPQKVLLQYSGLFFVPLASRLVNDDSPRCRKLASLAIKALLIKLDGNQRDALFNMCLQWLQETKEITRKLAAITCGLFVEVETAGFERRLKNVLPIIEHQIHPSKYEQNVTEDQERNLDHLLFNLINVIVKMCRECSLAVEPKYTTIMSDIWESIESHLLYPHTWVRLASCQLYGMLFASWTPDDLVHSAGRMIKEVETEPHCKKIKRQKSDKVEKNVNGQNAIEEVEGDYLTSNLDGKLHKLCGAFCNQLAAPELSLDLADQIVKNLIFVTKVLKLKSDDVPFVKYEDDEKMKTTSIKWLLRRLCKQAKTEASTNPTETLKRSSVFKWMAAVSLDLGNEKLLPYLPQILEPLVKEYTTSSTQAGEEFKTLVQEVIEVIKSTVGVETFSIHFAAIQKSVTEKRDGRKQKQALEAVAQPEVSAMRKMKKNLAKQAAKKRKIESNRPTFKLKKRKKDFHK